MAEPPPDTHRTVSARLGDRPIRFGCGGWKVVVVIRHSAAIADLFIEKFNPSTACMTDDEFSKKVRQSQ